MKRPIIALWLFLGVLVAMFAGLRIEIDYCRSTGAYNRGMALFGAAIGSPETHDGFRTWLEQEIGVSFEPDFVDYLSYHPFFPAASTPPGNWLILFETKERYDISSEEIREEVRKFLRAVGERDSHVLTWRDHRALSELRPGKTP